MISKALKWHETSAFLVEWLKAPLVTASIVPSSQHLAKSMVKTITPDMQHVIELGPGTGVFTRQLLATGLPESALTLVELNRTFAYKLQTAHPKATVINDGAEALSRFNLTPANAIVSGLPFLSMRDELVDAILEHSFAHLQADGLFIQFTYGYRCPVKANLLAKHGLQAQRQNFVLNNFPPASVYQLRKIAKKPSA